MNTIQNSFLRISVKEKGAELSSLCTIENDEKEYVWQADPDFWGRSSPILFPIIGLLKGNEYTYQGKTYAMNGHGFARDAEFQCIEKKQNRLVYKYQSNEQTLKHYPFLFELFIIYEIKDNRVDIYYEVINSDNKPIFFSIGGHPAFNCNLNEGNTVLEFEKDERVEIGIVNQQVGLMKNEKKSIPLIQKQLLLTNDLFAEYGTLVFEKLKSNIIILKDRKANTILKMTMDGFPYVGVWTPKKPAPFVCIEPWVGLPDMEDANQVLEEKKGIQRLEAGKTFKVSYQMEIL
ncbi:aldose 1-epimerase family protein [Chengkuizengella axinellae]|uniref:Aldose 1-epimerase family protein n=1 Tax=Chengkuizengella axinellae TaxID=3064388 RepID=A0ABT9J1A8_9BACL|nr:aldose 1-epimerase family protein [Chengkuizengella sp. 2205SS18-9]MDP5274800.1 aldose 1-epimerase family protein [Chengkuizengella sp. 2205SS18-9]